MNIKCAVFDLDGTLVNSLEDLTNSMNFALEQFNMPTHTPEECLSMIGHGKESFARNALPADQRHLTDKLVSMAWGHYSQNCCIKTKPYPEIKEMLDFYAENGVKLAVLTNKEQSVARKVADFCFPGHKFAKVIGEVNKIPPKPEPDEIYKLLDDLNIEPSNAILVGDSEADINTGKNAGIYTVGVTWGFRSRDELGQMSPDKMVDSPCELNELFIC